MYQATGMAIPLSEMSFYYISPVSQYHLSLIVPKTWLIIYMQADNNSDPSENKTLPEYTPVNPPIRGKLCGYKEASMTLHSALGLTHSSQSSHQARQMSGFSYHFLLCGIPHFQPQASSLFLHILKIQPSKDTMIAIFLFSILQKIFSAETSAKKVFPTAYLKINILWKEL